jgi:hypothetical protein
MGDTRKACASIEVHLDELRQSIESAANRWEDLGQRLDQPGGYAAAIDVREFLRSLDTVPTVGAAFEQLASAFERECGHGTEYARLRDMVYDVIERCESKVLDATPKRLKRVQLRKSLLDETRFHSNPDGYAGQISACCNEWELKKNERANLVAFALECQRVADKVRPILPIFDARLFLDFARKQVTVVDLAKLYMGIYGTHLRTISDAIQIVRNEMSRVPELAPVKRTMVDQFPATTRGDLGFVEHVSKEIFDQAIHQAIDGIRVRIPEALLRLKTWEQVLAGHAKPVSAMLQRELSLGTVVGLAERLSPLVDALRNAAEELWHSESSAEESKPNQREIDSVSASGDNQTTKTNGAGKKTDGEVPEYLDLIVNRERRTVQRIGYESVGPIELTATTWALFEKLLRCKGTPISAEVYVGTKERSETNRVSAQRGQLNIRLLPLGICVTKKAWKLIEGTDE